LTKEAIRATRNYLLYSIGGAAFAFAAMMFLITHNASGPFKMGGVLTQFPYGKPEITRLFWLFGFLGFGVKTAVFPVYKWLPDASVEPTPVTALLHAVAVVKAGAFAVIRLTYYCFGVNMLIGSWAQTTAVILTAFTIVFGSTFALKETNFKRRLAYSTVANMSYILFGAVLMTPSGLEAGLLHMAAHSCIKILAFFAAGAVLHITGRQSIYELDGIGKRMPMTFACFTIAALALTGIPPFSGFVSKWYLLTSATQTGGIAYIGVAAILISALLTAIYMLTIVRRAWFPDQNADLSGLPEVKETDWKMIVPMLIFAIGTLLCGIFSQPILNAAGEIAHGLI
jgi:multicomponent Na+:H+ antiporter subunit D